MSKAYFCYMAIATPVAIAAISFVLATIAQAADRSPSKSPAPATASKKPAVAPIAKSPDKTSKPQPDAEAVKPTTASEPVTVPEGVPPVILSKQHANLCRVKVGDSLPPIELPTTAGGDKKTKLADLYGKAATVVVFLASDREMSHMELADLATDVIEPFGSMGVAVVGVDVKENADKATAELKEVGKQIPMLVDDKGTAFGLVGSRRLPRTFVLDGKGKIIWFDIEYSHATRRELKQALAATVH